MANKNTYYGKQHKNLQMMVLVDGISTIRILGENNQPVASLKLCDLRADLYEQKVYLATAIDFSIGANTKIRKIEIHNVHDRITKDIEVDIGGSPTIYTLNEFEVRL